MDLTTNGVVITDAIKFLQRNKEKLTKSIKEENLIKESNEPDYDEDKEQLELEQEEGKGDTSTTNHVFWNRLELNSFCFKKIDDSLQIISFIGQF